MIEYEVEQLLKSRIKDGKKEFKVKWKGYKMSNCTWEPLKNIIHLKEDLKQLEKRERKEISAK